MKTSIFVGTSLDGYIARENGSFDFLAPYEVVENGWWRFMSTVDCVVMGRKTFETVLSLPNWDYGKRALVVLSTTLRNVRGPSGAACELMNCSPKQVLARLSSRGLKHAYVDGGETIQRFLREGLIQYITICRYPVLIGQGRPLFGALLHDVRLKHLGTRVSANGFVKSRYRIRGSSSVSHHPVEPSRQRRERLSRS